MALHNLIEKIKTSVNRRVINLPLCVAPESRGNTVMKATKPWTELWYNKGPPHWPISRTKEGATNSGGSMLIIPGGILAAVTWDRRDCCTHGDLS